MCLERGANNLHMVQLMPLPPHVSCSSKIQNDLPFWCQLTQVVLEKRPLNGYSSSSLVRYRLTVLLLAPCEVLLQIGSVDVAGLPTPGSRPSRTTWRHCGLEVTLCWSPIVHSSGVRHWYFILMITAGWLGFCDCCWKRDDPQPVNWHWWSSCQTQSTFQTHVMSPCLVFFTQVQGSTWSTMTCFQRLEKSFGFRSLVFNWIDHQSWLVKAACHPSALC